MRVYTSDQRFMRGRGLGAPYYRGAGLGSIFSRIYSSVVPIVKGLVSTGAKAAKSSTGKYLINKAKKTAATAGLNVVHDTLNGENVLESTKRELAKARAIMKQAGIRSVERAIEGPPPKKKKKPPPRPAKKKPKKTVGRKYGAGDLFGV